MNNISSQSRWNKCNSQIVQILVKFLNIEQFTTFATIIVDDIIQNKSIAFLSPLISSVSFHDYLLVLIKPTTKLHRPRLQSLWCLHEIVPLNCSKTLFLQWITRNDVRRTLKFRCPTRRKYSDTYALPAWWES